MLKTLTIEGLFDKFDYKIELQTQGITILTGPNGYGKTTILKIIHAFAFNNQHFFFQIPFKRIIFDFITNKIIFLKKDKESISITNNDVTTIITNKNLIIQKEVRRFLDNNPYYVRVDENLWADRRTDVIMKSNELIDSIIEENPGLQEKIFKIPFPEYITVYLIKEQRLLRRSVQNRKKNSPYFIDEIRTGFINTIEEYSKELSRNLKNTLAAASKIGQELDSSFPRRLFDETTSINENEFNTRYNVIKEKQKALSIYGLSAIKQDSQTTFKEENAKALLVYLNDTEKKLSVFDDILQKLEIFSTILNDRSFAFKQLEISSEFGFKFKTENGNNLSLSNLSSGEQQEVVLLYELLFRVNSNTLVLIDEPEISLHVAWQKEFLNDLLKIINLQKITVITATHSPQIIGEHWDLVVDLEEISR